MRIIGRILIILLAVAIVSGSAVAIVNATGFGSRLNFGRGDGGFERQGFDPGQQPPGNFNGQGFNPGQRPEGGFRPERDGRGGGGLGFARSFQVLIPLAIIVAIFLGVERLLNYLRVQRLAKAKVQNE